MNNKKIHKKKTIKYDFESAKRTQKGLSLVELLIAMVVGLFLLAGVITSFVGTKESDRTRRAISQMDGDARAALAIMRQTISHAGYPSIHGKVIENNKAFYTREDGNLPNPLCQGGLRRDVLTPRLSSATRDRFRRDVLTIVALTDNPCLDGNDSCPNVAQQNPDAKLFADCTGGGADRDERTVSCSADDVPGTLNSSTKGYMYSTFRLGGGSRSNTLFCDGSRGGSQPLVDNIVAMQFLYGVQQNDGTTIYKRANLIENDEEWPLVSSVQVGLLVQSAEDNILKQSSGKTYRVLQSSNYTISDSRRLYKVYRTTINLANYNKGSLL